MLRYNFVFGSICAHISIPAVVQKLGAAIFFIIYDNMTIPISGTSVVLPCP